MLRCECTLTVTSYSLFAILLLEFKNTFKIDISYLVLRAIDKNITNHLYIIPYLNHDSFKGFIVISQIHPG